MRSWLFCKIKVSIPPQSPKASTKHEEKDMSQITIIRCSEFFIVKKLLSLDFIK